MRLGICALKVDRETEQMQALQGGFHGNPLANAGLE